MKVASLDYIIMVCGCCREPHHVQCVHHGQQDESSQPAVHCLGVWLLQSIQQLSPIVCKVFFMDGKTKAVSLQPRDTTIEVLAKVARKIGLKSVEGWAMYEVSSRCCCYSSV